MVEERARVVALDAAGVAWVESLGAGGCGGCAESGHCGVGLLGKALPRRTPRLRVDVVTPLAIGDTVVLGLPEGALVKAAAGVYLLPLAGLFMGSLVAATVWPAAEPATILLGAAGFLAGAVFARRWTSRARSRLSPVVLRREA